MSISYEKKNHLMWATIDRPEAHNAIDFSVMDGFEQVLETMENDEEVRVFVLSGAGKEAFISGGDLQKFHQLKDAEQAEAMARRMHNILQRIEELPCWTIACMNGNTYGGGCEIALAFDFRIATKTSRFGFTQGKFYLPPGWGGLTRLIEIVGRSTALRWLAEAAVIGAPEAEDKGFIDKVTTSDSLIETTEQWAKELSANNRDYIAHMKKIAYTYSTNYRNSIEAEIEPFSKFWEDPEHHRRVEEFLKRKDGG